MNGTGFVEVDEENSLSYRKEKPELLLLWQLLQQPHPIKTSPHAQIKQRWKVVTAHLLKIKVKM